jgi:hypothetical protein
MRKQAFFACAGMAALIASWAWAADDGEKAPDFSGLWGRNAFDLEPLPAGPQPLTNLKRRPDGTGNFQQLVGDYTNPILKSEAAEIVKKRGDISITGRNFPDPSNQCGAYNPPYTFTMQLGFQMLQKKDAITILYNQDDQVRHIRLNTTHPANLVPSAMGDSIGHYEGDELVVDTVGIEVSKLSMTDHYGSPNSPALHVVERYRLIDGAAAKVAQERHEKWIGRVGGPDMPPRPGLADSEVKGLQVALTVEDPNVFTTPWSALVTYRQIRGDWLEQVCADNPIEHYAGEWQALPKADKPDF